MKTFNLKKILIPLDFSETALLALEHGAYMASLFKAEIILLHVIKPTLSAYNTENMPISLPIDIMKYQEETAARKLQGISKKIRNEYALKVEPLYETGFVCSTIISVADRYNADLIIMGTHGISGFAEKFIGSNAYKVVNEANCPVITIQAHAVRKGFQEIVLPIDHSFYSRQKVTHAIELAQHFNSRIHILGLSHTEDKTEINKLKIKLEQVEKFIEKHDVDYDTQINVGTNYAKLTMAYADATGADLIVIMTEWEEDLTGLFIGPFARQIVNHSKIPVMSIRPEVKSELVESGMLWMEQH
jgi:nucleotide-binding universal stress UspA family protein